MKIKTESKTTIELAAFFENGKLKTSDCEIGDWDGSDYCEQLNLSEEIENLPIPEGAYKIIITLEKVD